MMLSEQKDKTGKMRKLLTHPDRNGIVYTLDRENGDLISADKIDDTVNGVTQVDLKTGMPVRDPGIRHPHGPQGDGRLPVGHGLPQPGPRRLRSRNEALLSWASTTSAWTGSRSCFPTAPASSSSAPRCGCIRARRATVRTTSVSVRSRPTTPSPASTSGRRWSASRSGAARSRPAAIWCSTERSTASSRPATADTGELLWKFKLPSGVIGHPMTYEHNGVQYVAIMYGVGGWPGVGLVFDLQDPTAGLGAVGAFKKLAELHPDGRRSDGVLARRQEPL